MKQSFTKENIFKLISNFDSFEFMDISEFGEAYKLNLGASNKSICITWPYELGEVFLDFNLENDIIYQDWFECLESDEVEEFINYIEQVAKRYLLSETRIKRKGFIFKSFELQYKSNVEWVCVLHP